jgi:hypothetical protein
LLQRGHLIVSAHLDAIGQVAAIHVLGGNVEIGHGFGDAAADAHADEQGYQLDDTKNNCDANQNIEEDLGFVSEGAEQRGVQHRGPSIHQYQPGQGFSGMPIDRAESSGEWNVLIEAVCGRWHASGLHPRVCVFTRQAYRRVRISHVDDQLIFIGY